MKKRSRFYSLIMVGLITALLFNCFGVLGVSAEEESVFLSDLLIAEPNRMSEYTGWKILLNDDDEPIPGLNKDCNGKPIKMAGKYYEKGVGTHSAETDLSYLEIDLEGLNYEYFTALVGMSDEKMGQEVERNRAGFMVEVDENEVATTDVLTYDSEPVEISVSIKGASTLRLCLEPGDTRYSDIAIWANAKLSNSPSVDRTASDTPIAKPTAEPTVPPIGDNMIYLSDYLKNDMSKILAYVGHSKVPDQEENKYPALDTTYDGETIVLRGNTYLKGIGMHSSASANDDTYLNIDIKDSGYTQFTATIGMFDVNLPQDVERNVASFIVEVDGKQVFESDVMYYDTKPQDIKINIKDASVLTLRLDKNLAPYSDSAIWANACLAKVSDVSEATPTSAATPDIKTTNTPKAPTPTAKGSTVSQDDGLSIVWIIVIAAAAVAVIAVVVVIVLKKKKGSNEEK